MITWSSPWDDGGSPVNNYVLEYKLSESDDNWTTLIHTTSLLYPIENLKESNLYDFRVWAENRIGRSQDAQYLLNHFVTFGQAPKRPMPPNDVTGLQVVPGTLNSYTVRLEWKAPEVNGFPVLGYYIDRSDGF